MKIEICENTFWLTLWTVIVVSLCTLFGLLSSHYNQRTLAAFNAGYQETEQVTGGYWVKATP